MIRLQPSKHANNWFADLGIGTNYIAPLYRTDHKHFSKESNFGAHVAFGRQSADHRQSELALRAQHFSNAGIARPNPGESFVQLRYSHRLGRAQTWGPAASLLLICDPPFSPAQRIRQRRPDAITDHTQPFQRTALVDATRTPPSFR